MSVLNFFFVALCLLIFSSLTTSSPLSHLTTPTTYHPTPADALSFLGGIDPELKGAQHVVDVREKLVVAAKKWALSTLTKYPTPVQSAEAETYPYWRFVPLYITSLFPNNSADATWSGDCFQSVTGNVQPLSSGGNYSIILTMEKPKSLFCSDYYLFGTVEGYMTQTFFFKGEHRITWTFAANVTPAEAWDVQNKGIRIFRFLDDEATVLTNLATTVSLFDSLLTQDVSEETAALNMDFLAKYPQMKMYKRSIEENILDESLIHSGDFFGVMRLDGLDPMLAWAMGAHTGHTVLALWINNELFIVESTTKSSYWPTNGIQRTPYRTWLAQAKAAGFGVTHAPIRSDLQGAFNATNAIKFFNTIEGLDYGYTNLLYGWQDTIQDNYPCMPPDYTMCMTPHHVQILFAFIDEAIPSIGDIIFKQAINIRLGTTNLSWPDLLYTAAQKGIPADQIMTIVERDDFQYELLRYGNETVSGPSMVCCAFVCSIWKAAGMFNNISNQINCMEQTNYDDYSFAFLSSLPTRPASCATADPNNPLCQLEGEYTVELIGYGQTANYPHMREKCPSLAPNYSRPNNC